MSATETTNNAISSLQGWLKKPFDSNMTAGGWFAFFGLFIVISVAWGIILKDLKGEL